MRKVPYPHPGEILLEEFLKPLGITQYRLAKEIGVPQRRIGEIVAGKKAGRETPEEITIFDSTGMALQDVAAAAVVFERARQHRFGVSMSFAA